MENNERASQANQESLLRSNTLAVVALHCVLVCSLALILLGYKSMLFNILHTCLAFGVFTWNMIFVSHCVAHTTASDQIRIHPNCVECCCTTWCDTKIVFRVNRPPCVNVGMYLFQPSDGELQSRYGWCFIDLKIVPFSVIIDSKMEVCN
jgi:hypothetical protein